MPGRRSAVPAAMVALPGEGAIRIQPVGRGEYVRTVIHSYPGWGKTSLIATGPEAGFKTLIIRSSADLIPARALDSGADQFVADTWEDMGEILDHVRMQKHGYDWVWWDNISIAQDKLLDDIWEATTAIRPDRLALTPAGGLDKGEYGRNMERIQQWVRHMVGTNSFHFGIMAHPFEGQHPTNDEGGFLLRPYVQGKQMTEKICGYANLVGFLELMDDGEGTQWRRLHVRESARWYAKDQYDAFPKGYIDNPTVGKIMTSIEASKGKKPATTSRRGRGRREQ